jgi:hypothetical protein
MIGNYVDKKDRKPLSNVTSKYSSFVSYIMSVLYQLVQQQIHN